VSAIKASQGRIDGSKRKKMKDKTEKQLIKEPEAQRPHVGVPKNSKEECRQEKEKEKQYIRDLTFLSRAALNLVELSPEENIYRFIGERLKELIGNCVIFVNSFDEASASFCVREALGIGEHMDAVIKVLGRHPIGISTPISAEARLGLTSGKLEKVPGGLYELATEKVPKTICNTIEKILGLGDIYAMGFAWGGELFGSTAIAMRKGIEPRNPSIVEAFINQASIALQRRQAEEALRKARDELQMRVSQ